MRILADVNIERETVEKLRGRGFDVRRSDTKERRRLKDQDLLRKAISEERILLTKDDDFTDIKIEEHKGIIYIPKREKPAQTVRKILRIAELLSQEDMENQLIFLSEW